LRPTRSPAAPNAAWTAAIRSASAASARAGRDRETTLNRECARLTALGVPRRQRYGGKAGRIIERTCAWGISSLSTIIHNPVYKGEGILDSRYGTMARTVPALVDSETWERAQRATLDSRRLSKKNAKNTYVLRGIIQCGD